MEISFEEVISLVNPNDFVGRVDELNLFDETIKEIINDQPAPNWFHISGVAGSGKSSLMRKFMETAMTRGAIVFSLEVPINPDNMVSLFNGFKEKLDNLSPEWRSFIQKKTGTSIGEVSLAQSKLFFKKEISEQNRNEFLTLFFENLDKVNSKFKQERQKIGVFLDNLERISYYEQYSVFDLIRSIITESHKRGYNLFFVTTGLKSTQHLIKCPEGICKEITISAFDFKDAELMMRRIGKLIKTQREQILSVSTRLPFDIKLRQYLLSHNLDFTKITSGMLQIAFGLSNIEVELLSQMSKSEVNHFKKSDLTAHSDIETIKRLQEGLILIQDGEFYSFISPAIWELIKQVFLPIDPRTEILLLLSRVQSLSSEKQLPYEEDVNIIKRTMGNISDRNLIFSLATEFAKTSEIALENGLINTSLEFLDISTSGLEKIQNYERLGELSEQIAKKFAMKDHNYYAAEIYHKSGRYFKKAGIEWRSIANYREAGRRYRRHADQIDLKMFHYAARSIYQKSIKSFLEANEKKSAQQTRNQAIISFEELPVHKAYFEKQNYITN